MTEINFVFRRNSRTVGQDRRPKDSAVHASIQHLRPHEQTVAAKADLKHLEVPNLKLQNLAVEGRSLIREQAALEARKQELSARRRQVALRE